MIQSKMSLLKIRTPLYPHSPWYLSGYIRSRVEKPATGRGVHLLTADPLPSCFTVFNTILEQRGVTSLYLLLVCWNHVQENSHPIYIYWTSARLVRITGQCSLHTARRRYPLRKYNKMFLSTQSLDVILEY
jgi:hypothetical protein